jgi:cytosine/adenosine deaminase-related metal-dependent hydrolase
MSLRPKTTVVRASNVWTGGASPTLYDERDIVIEDGIIAAIEPNYRGRADVEVDGEGCLALPGLINAHAHAGCTPTSRGLSEDLDLPEAGAFYHSLIPLLSLGYSSLSREEFQAVIEWDAIAMLLGGATTIVEENFGGAEMWIELVERLGFRSSIGLTYPGNVSAIGYVHEGKIVRDDSFDVAAGLERGLRLHDDWDGAFEDRLRVHLSPHASDTVPDEVLRETKQLADERGTTIHLHLAQHLSENEAVRERTDETPVEYLARIGFLGPDVLATHVTYTDRSDWDLLASTGTNIIHCAYRKAKEGLTSPFWEYLERGVNVAIATDSFSHDLVENLKLTALLGKVREGAVGHPRAEHVVACATHGAAKALRRSDLGTLQPGARGDIAVIDLSTPFNAPVFDPLKSLVYYSNGADLRHSLVDGRPIVADRVVLGSDISAVGERANAACARLWELAREQGALPVPTARQIRPPART